MYFNLLTKTYYQDKKCFNQKDKKVKGIDDRDLTEKHVLLPRSFDWFTTQTFERKKNIFFSLGTSYNHQKAH